MRGQRYTDLYDHTVALAKRVLKLEDARNFKNEEVQLLRSKVSTQASIIKAMSDSTVRWYRRMRWRLQHATYVLDF